MRMMMKTASVLGLGLALAACGTNGAKGGAASGEPVKHQPGSWSNKIQIVSLDAGPGVDATKIRAGLQQMFDAASNMSICITPEAAAKDNPAANMERMAAQGKKCDFDRKNVGGATVDLAGTCTDTNGTKIKLAVTGTNGATEQDMTVKTEPADASGPMKGSMVMRITSRRTGECKPGDITPPAQS